ncbi:ccf70306-c3d0-4cf4-ba40-9fae75dd97e9 [Sclerotinia trifoliorum]|uniref:Ccf70306-c3d0-4cf4-ba40-9fae75dd97e9 n=1 Tax=Sclerotinia trifoliorum TaxID=28548 RepID=A0A8H2VRY4_9HELO|nr:ccf70306-c3d0-4cf4-ba40-9fae75dd97e9 [Sclerotinia trifoliorum]
MIFSYCLMLLLFSNFANTQSLSDEINSLPSCSDSCLDIATGSLGCSVGDFSCFCADESGSPTQGSTVSSATSCIQNSCSLLDASTTLKVVGQICILINDSTSSIFTSSSTTSRASSSSTTSLKSSKTSSSSILSSPMASTSVTATSTPTSLASAPSKTSTSSHSSSGKGLSNVVIGMIVLAVVATLLIIAVIARLLWKRRANRKNSSTGGRFQNLDEEDGLAKKPAELQGNDAQIFKWGGIGVRKSIRVHTQRITSYISPVSPKHRSRNESWGDARDHLATIDENLRGVGQSPEPVGRIDTSPVRWPSTSTANSPTTPEMTEPMGALFPPHHYRFNSSRESLPPSLPALDLPSITLSSTSRPNTPHLPLPKSPPPREAPVKTVARLDRPFSTPNASTPFPSALSVSDNYSYPGLPTPSIALIPNTPYTPTTTRVPISPALPPSAQFRRPQLHLLPSLHLHLPNLPYLPRRPNRHTTSTHHPHHLPHVNLHPQHPRLATPSQRQRIRIITRSKQTISSQ